MNVLIIQNYSGDKPLPQVDGVSHSALHWADLIVTITPEGGKVHKLRPDAAQRANVAQEFVDHQVRVITLKTEKDKNIAKAVKMREDFEAKHRPKVTADGGALEKAKRALQPTEG